MILQADKGKKLVALDEATYLRMATEHIGKDNPITETELITSQKVLNATSKPIINIFNFGTSHSERNHVRCWNNVASNACEPAKLRLLPKIHKPPKPNGDPQSRPLVAAHVGVSTRAGDLVARILEPMVTLSTPRMEDLSTEEAISQLDETASSLRKRGIEDAVITSLDVKALYPSIPHNEASREVAEFVMTSENFTVENFDSRSAQIFIASNMSETQIKQEGIENLIPERSYKYGNRPQNTTLELTTMNKTQTTSHDNLTTSQAPSKWKTKDVPNNEITRRKLCSLVLQIAVLNIFQQHCYTFNGTTYKQLEGCPIGLKLTGIIARIIMDSWARKFISTLDNAGIELHLFIKYVDDVNLVVQRVTTKTGSFWNRNMTSICQIQQTITDSDNNTTYKILLETANSIYKYLDFTIDTVENHPTSRVPMLDLQTWVETFQNLEGKLYSQVLYSYYEKPVTSSRVTQASSAYTWKK